MKLEHVHRQQMMQKQILSLQQIESLHLLSLTNVEIGELLQKEFEDNLLLEKLEQPTGTQQSQHVDPWCCQDQYDYNYADLKQFVWEQLDLHKYSDIELQVIQFLIGCLDEQGYVREKPEEVAALIRTSEDIVHRCLNDLRELEPVGIFSDSLSMCLLRQLDVLGVKDEIMRLIVEHYLQELADGQIGQLARRLGISTSQIRKYLALIEKLNPRPGIPIHKEVVHYVIPDIIVTGQGVQLTIQLNDKWIENYQLNANYLRVLTQGNLESSEYWDMQRKRVSFLLSAIEKRRRTLIRITQAIIELQGGELASRNALKPMILKHVAETLNVDRSTVSRAIKNKYIQYPNGAMLMKDMFMAPLRRDEEISSTDIKQVIAEMIASENRNKPFSDSQLVDMLKHKQYYISRRCVSKYREELGIKSSFERKYDEMK
ncbi:RNA polymerase factor sigma-54 [Paenibacillus sp. FSL R10-2734]|uniref:RNA polymerase factor sigma-54 n=1 Tax=Paenibacillus sp. FSL R10-2734 TaxID=2954691 RepID=UPI0030DBAE75